MMATICSGERVLWQIPTDEYTKLIETMRTVKQLLGRWTDTGDDNSGRDEV